MVVRRACAVVVLAVVVGGLHVVTSSAPAEAARFTPRGGVTFNSPVGNRARQRAILNKIIKSIRATPRGQEIHIMTWNLLSRDAVNALLRAQKRKVRVRVIMSRSNAEIGGTVNQSFKRLKRGLYRGNKGRQAHRKSWAVLCTKSCRGRHGAAHGKYYLFSRAGRARHVVIQGSANLTVASATNQWNDVYTSTNRPAAYSFMLGVFNQMARDRPVRRTAVRWTGGRDRLLFFPDGRGPDPVMRLLNRVRCRGAATPGGRTRIRIAPDVIRESRGMRLGGKVRQLWQAGCNVRVGYTIVGRDVGRAMRAPGRRGRLPMRHLVQDRNDDGQFDNYFHMKTTTIVGRIGRKRASYVTFNGSANWSSVSARSDENMGISWRKGTTLKVEKHINYWYHSPAFTPDRRVDIRPPGDDGRADGRRAAVRHRTDQRRRPVRPRRHGLSAGSVGARAPYRRPSSR